MQIQGPHGGGSKDKIFVQVDSLVALARGDGCVWDLAASTPANMVGTTQGARVTTAAETASVRFAGLAEGTVSAGGSGLTDERGTATLYGKTVLVQSYGHHDAATLVGTAAVSAPFVLCHGTTAGVLRQAVTATNADVISIMGFSFTDSINGTITATANVFLKCM